MGLGERITRLIEGDLWSRAEEHFRDRHTAFGDSDLDYERVRPAYEYGFRSGQDERFAGRRFDEIVSELEAGWTGDLAAQCGSWDTVRGHVNRAFDHARQR